jgi:hypothetical protein
MTIHAWESAASARDLYRAERCPEILPDVSTTYQQRPTDAASV